MTWGVRKAGVLGTVLAGMALLPLAGRAQAGRSPNSTTKQNDTWKQPPEGRAAAASEPLNCSGSISTGDGKTTEVSNCAPPTASPVAPTTAKRFPYPGESPADKGASAPEQGARTQDTPQPGTAAPAKKFPYPGEQGSAGSSSTPAQPETPGAQNGLKDAGSSGESSSAAPPESSSSGSSSSNSSSSSSSNAGANSSGSDDPSSPFTDPDTAPAPKRGRKKLPPVPRQTPSEREEEDVKVAGFYLNDGNYRAAYSRAQDAVGLTEDDPEAHLMLAEAARKLGKLDEAQQHYKRCLALDPTPKLRRSAEHALKEMSGGA